MKNLSIVGQDAQEIKVSDVVCYVNDEDKTHYTVKEVYDNFVVTCGGQFEFLTMFKDEIKKVNCVASNQMQDICLCNYTDLSKKVCEKCGGEV